MLAKRDVSYYRRLAHTQGALGIAMLCVCLVSGVSAKYHTDEINAYVPYWVAIPLTMQAMVTMLAAKTGKRWPLAIWMPLFLITFAGICAYLIILPPFKLDIFEKYPCFVQRNPAQEKTRCVCAYTQDNYFLVDGAEDISPCVRALNIVLIMGNINYMFTILALIPELCMFVLACNDLCCLSCRRTADIPQVVVAGGVAGQNPAQYVPVQAQTVTYRTDEQQPGSSAGPRPTQQSDQAGPLPQKPKNPGDVPHSY